MRILTLMMLLAVASVNVAASEFVAIHVSDVHYDPFFGTSNGAKKECRDSSTPWYGLPGCDTSDEMMKNAMNAIASQLSAVSSSDPLRTVYYTGDWLRHDMVRVKGAPTVAKAIFGNLSKELLKLGTNVVAHPAIAVNLGNEDFIPDYHFNVSQAGRDPLLAMMANTLKRDNLMTDEEAKTFSYCGFASKVLPNATASGKQIRVVSLNTLIWTTKVSPAPTESDPCGQFAWLESTLSDARNASQIVHILSHIFPDVVFWKPSYYAVYKTILKKYSDVVAAQFFGHIHRMSFLTAEPESDGSFIAPIHIGGPITRASKTNPDFALTFIDSESGAVNDRRQIFFNSSSLKWETGYSLKDVLGVNDLSAPNLHSASIRLMNTSSEQANAQFQKFWTMMSGGIATSACSGICQRLIMCSTVSIDFLEVFECKILARANLLRSWASDDDTLN